MIMHAKSLEILSNAYKDLEDIDEDDHMEVNVEFKLTDILSPADGNPQSDSCSAS